MTTETYASFQELVTQVAQVIAADLKAALAMQDRVLMAVPGGTTPGPIFDDLCQVDLDWARVDIILTDERWVPGDSPRSNTALLRDRLLVNKAADATLLAMYAPADQPEDALGPLMADIAACLPIDVAILGMGADMHTASLFPDSAELQSALAADAPVLVPVRPASQPEARVTLPAHVLNAAKRKHIVFKGADKLAALENAKNLTPDIAPIKAILDGAIVHYSES